VLEAKGLKVRVIQMAFAFNGTTALKVILSPPGAEF
jgi:hypothetical protein